MGWLRVRQAALVVGQWAHIPGVEESMAGERAARGEGSGEINGAANGEVNKEVSGEVSREVSGEASGQG